MAVAVAVAEWCLKFYARSAAESCMRLGAFPLRNVQRVAAFVSSGGLARLTTDET